MSAFEVFRDARGCWHARRTDGLVEGWFTARIDAMRFARREARHTPLPRQ